MFHNILVSVDGSPDSERALSEAIDLARCENARLTILTAVSRPPSLAYLGISAGAAQELADAFEKEARQTIEQARERVPQEVSVETILTENQIQDALLDRIEKGGHDLLVMGSRGRGAVASTVLGSVSHDMLNHSPVPVLIVHSPREDGEG